MNTASALMLIVIIFGGLFAVGYMGWAIWLNLTVTHRVEDEEER